MIGSRVDTTEFPFSPSKSGTETTSVVSQIEDIKYVYYFISGK